MLCSRHSPCAGRSLAAGRRMPREGSHHPRVAAAAAAREPRLVPTVVKRMYASELPVNFILRRPVQPGHRVGVLGSVHELDNWDEKSVSTLLKCLNAEERYCPIKSLRGGLKNTWVGWRHLPVGRKVEFKFVLIDANGHITWVNDIAGVGDRNLELMVEEGVTLEMEGASVEVCPETFLGYKAIAEEEEGEGKASVSTPAC